MKTCSVCKVEKELTSFYVQKDGAQGVTSRCKGCVKKSNKKWMDNNKDSFNKYTKEWYQKNKDKVLLRCKEHYKNNKNQYVEKRAKRRAAQLKRTPKWSDAEKIKAYYDVCSFFNEVNGFAKYHVDHIIPLQGKLVSGLHVHNNLQVILAKDNISKGNNYTVSGY